MVLYADTNRIAPVSTPNFNKMTKMFKQVNQSKNEPNSAALLAILASNKFARKSKKTDKDLNPNIGIYFLSSRIELKRTADTTYFAFRLLNA